MPAEAPPSRPSQRGCVRACVHSSTSAGVTVSACVYGSIVGTLLCFTNMFFGLQTGWITLASMQCAVLAYGLSAVNARVCGRGSCVSATHTAGGATHMTVGENVIAQTIAVGINSMPLAAGFVGIVPALAILSRSGADASEGRSGLALSLPEQLAWALALAFFGVYMAAPLRRRAIIVEKLPFPSGTATAHIIAALHKVPLVGQNHGTGARARTPMLPAAAGDDRSPEGSGASVPRSGAAAVADMERRPLVADTAPMIDETYVEDDVASLAGDSGVDTGGVPHEEEEMALALERSNAAGDSTLQHRLWRSLIWCFALSAAYSMFSYLLPVVAAIPVFNISSAIAGATAWGWTLSMSPAGMGQGMIMGTKTCLSMLAGALVGWGLLAPLSQQYGWATGAPMNWQTGGRGFILWIGLAVMLVDSVLSLGSIAVGWLMEFWRSRRRRTPATDAAGSHGHARGNTVGTDPWHANTKGDDDSDFDEPQQVPTYVWVVGFGMSTVLAIALLVPITGTLWYEPLAAVILSMPISAIAVRAMGETDMNPASGISKLSQAIFGLIAPGNVVSNLVAGAVAEAGAMQAGDLMHDYRVGKLLGVAPRAQFIAQIIGATAGIATTVAAYNLYSNAFGVPSGTLPAPTAAVWIAMAQLVNGGSLPPNSIPFCAAFGGLVAARYFIVLWHSHRVNAGHAVARPVSLLASACAAVSPVAFGVGMYVAPSWSIPRVLGALASLWWAKRYKESHAALHIMVATGLLLGEGIMSIVTAVLTVADLRPLTCAGCAPGQCGSFCP